MGLRAPAPRGRPPGIDGPRRLPVGALSKQNTSLAFTDALRDAGICGSSGSVGDALDNALIESAIGLFKTELVDRYPRTWTGRADLEIATASWVHW